MKRITSAVLIAGSLLLSGPSTVEAMSPAIELLDNQQYQTHELLGPAGVLCVCIVGLGLTASALLSRHYPILGTLLFGTSFVVPPSCYCLYILRDTTHTSPSERRPLTVAATE